ncbi:MAG TPA: zinc-binding alcohol dehydrogenase [Geminicoccus sp.]|uniref:zinc-dependent alcohol dehydrogenase n=1 Tax=Geminicoccus sp. TaxID=2024832 RepID=UPI002BC3C885|nr:zinc-binding alcohol dehydrogenase [Geminicoccus sp.]HWL66926.1 zinc-binding alcohol dehydrogenase [Geminicoccus sp.]
MTRAFWWVDREQAELRPEAPGEGAFLIRARYGALSRGTERLVATGAVPPGEWARMACPAMGGAFPFPVKYGYCVVGQVERGPADWQGRTVFTLHPHQERFAVADADALTPVPDGVPPERAVLLANLETALNAAWDAPLMPGMRVLVLGAGVLGCLFARIARQMPGVEIFLADRDPRRRALADAMDVPFADAPVTGCDLVVEATGRPEALEPAISACGREAALLVLSWYGEHTAPVALGGAFHSQRLRLVSSQVGTVAPAMRARVDYGERRRRAARLLADPALDALIGPPLPFDQLPARALKRLLDPDDGRAPLVVYEGGQ